MGPWHSTAASIFLTCTFTTGHCSQHIRKKCNWCTNLLLSNFHLHFLAQSNPKLHAGCLKRRSLVISHDTITIINWSHYKKYDQNTDRKTNASYIPMGHRGITLGISDLLAFADPSFLFQISISNVGHKNYALLCAPTPLFSTLHPHRCCCDSFPTFLIPTLSRVNCSVSSLR